MAILIAVGKHAHTIIGNTADDDRAVPNNIDGVRAVLALDDNSIVFIGNRRWVTPFASALRRIREEIVLLCRKVAIEHGTRGKLGSMVNVARHLRDNGLLDPRPFFTKQREHKPLDPLHEEALLYINAANEVRRARHMMLNSLYILFPEIIPQKSGIVADEEFVVASVSDIFSTKKMARVLEDPRVDMVQGNDAVPESVRVLAEKSIGHFVDAELYRTEYALYRTHLAEYRRLLEEKERILLRLRADVAMHPIVSIYGDGDTVVMLAALIGDEIYSDWRRLRAFAGCALTRQETTGKKRISRMNGAIRQYVYLFASLTKDGKEMAKEIRAAADERAQALGKEKASHKTVKVIEGVLRRMRMAVKQRALLARPVAA